MRTGAELVVDTLVAAGVPYLVGIPGHGNVNLFDAALSRRDRIRVLHTMHEQSAVHLADGYYRAVGRPLAVTTSIGPGAANTVVGVATAYVDSTAVLVITGSVHTYMRGHAVLQELERDKEWAAFPRVVEPIVKRHWQPSRVDQLPFVLQRAFNAMLGGRPAPVLVDLPMDVQAETTEAQVPDIARHLAPTRLRPAWQDVERAARLLVEARRPVVVVGGGVITADAARELVALAEYARVPVVTTWMGKGAMPEDHPLYGWHVGDTASTVGNRLAATADVVLAVGCRFTDWSSSSYRKGVTYAIPPSRLIQLDIDPLEIGKNYPVEIGLLGDARSGLQDLLDAVRDIAPSPVEESRRQNLEDLHRWRQEWEETLRPAREFSGWPTTISRALVEIRKVADRGAVVVTGAGLPQAQVYQEFPVYEPRTHLTSGGFSTMGFTLPAAIGAKLARPDRQVLAVAGDGDLLQTVQELAVLAELDLPVVVVVLNNHGWQSINNLQATLYGADRTVATAFSRRGETYSPDFAAVARAFGIEGVRVGAPEEIGPAVARALQSGGPFLVEIPVQRERPWALLHKTGWWDVPVGPQYPESHRRYVEGRKEEQL